MESGDQQQREEIDSIMERARPYLGVDPAIVRRLSTESAWQRVLAITRRWLGLEGRSRS